MIKNASRRGDMSPWKMPWLNWPATQQAQQARRDSCSTAGPGRAGTLRKDFHNFDCAGMQAAHCAGHIPALACTHSVCCCRCCSHGRRPLAWRRHEQPAVVAAGKHPQHIELLCLGCIQQGLNVGLPTGVTCAKKGQKRTQWGGQHTSSRLIGTANVPACTGSTSGHQQPTGELGLAGCGLLAGSSAGRLCN